MGRNRKAVLKSPRLRYELGITMAYAETAPPVGASFSHEGKEYPALVFDYSTMVEKEVPPTRKNSYAIFLKGEDGEPEAIVVVLQHKPLHEKPIVERRYWRPFSDTTLRSLEHEIYSLADPRMEDIVEQIKNEGYFFADEEVERYLKGEV